MFVCKRLMLAGGSGFLISLLCLNLLYPLPSVHGSPPSVMVLAEDGTVLRTFGDARGVHRYWITNEQVAPFYIDAVLDFEDRWFFWHPGINPVSLVRASFQWVIHRRVISGGSTLSMQVARLLDPHSRSIAGKLWQMFRALQLEWVYSKDEILNLYINLAPFGGNVEGVEAASRIYFNKSALDLTPPESALLASLPQRPSALRPDKYPDRAVTARNKVLGRMLTRGSISDAAYYLFSNSTLRVNRQPLKPMAPLLSRELRRSSPYEPIIRTTIDADLQRKIERLAWSIKGDLPKRSSLAILVVENESGKILGYKGSIDFHDDSRFSHVDMVTSSRSPGSALKPFIYGLAIDHGVVHSQSMLTDAPTSFNGYKPRNIDGAYRGDVSTAEALQLSLNVPAVQVLNRVGPRVFEEVLGSAGITLQHPDPNLSVGLGGTGMSLFDLVSLYRSLANGGVVDSLMMRASDLASGGRRVMSEESAWIIYTILREQLVPDRPLPAFRRSIAWKTGTSYGYRDFWSIGVSPSHTVGVWVGRPDGAPVLGYLGATAAAPIMFDVFDFLPRPVTPLEKPAMVSREEICWPSGRRSSSNPDKICRSRRFAWIKSGLVPPTMNSIEREIGDPLPSLEITSLRDGQHYFKHQISFLPLRSNTNRKWVRWYANGVLVNGSVLDLAGLSGAVRVSVCEDAGCMSSTIYVH